jgi:predicted Zn-dependent peptidase
MNANTYRLPNGLRIIHQPLPLTSQVTYAGIAINAGTRDEQDNESGMAHFVEHLLFKGTERRRAWHILNRMESVGGDLNAYTNKEETVIYSTFLNQHLSRAIELMTDIVFHSTFPQAEIEKEAEVVIDEIQSYRDTPSELIFDDFEELLYPQHPLGRNILGKEEQLKGFQTADVLRFTRRFYHPANMVLFVRGNVAFRQIVRLATRYTADVPTGTLLPVRTAPSAFQPETRTVQKETHQAHVLMGTTTYPATDERRTALYLLNNLLGGPGMNSRLNVALRERRGLVYTVESNVTAYTDSGTFGIYFGCDPEDRDKCIRLVGKELQQLRDTLLSSSALTAAKKQLIGQMGVATDNNENLALSMGKSYLHYNKWETAPELYRRIDELTAQQLRDVANELLTKERLSVLMYT